MSAPPSPRPRERDGPSFGRILLLLRPFVAPELPRLTLAFACGVVTASTQAGVLLLLIPLWNLLFPADALDTPAATTGVGRAFAGLEEWARSQAIFEDPRLTMLALVCGVAFLAAVAGGAAQVGFTWLTSKATYRMVVELRVEIARHLMGLSLRYHEKRRFGDLLSRVSSDVTSVLGAVNEAARGLVLDPLMALAYLTTAFLAAPRPTIGVILALPLLLWPALRLARRVRRGSNLSHTSLGASVQGLTQMFAGVRTVKSFGGTEREIESYRRLNRDYLAKTMRMVRALALTHGWTAFYSVAGVALLIGVLGVLKVQLGWFQGAGELGAFILAVSRVNNYTKAATRAYARVHEAAGAAERILELFDEPAEVVERPDPVRLSGLGSGIRIEGVRFRYPDSDVDALRDLSLEVRPGETLALVGPSGAGKSTLIDLLARFIDPTEGCIRVDGHDLRDVALADWTRQYALVGQTPFLFHSTIGENIRYGRPEATDAEVRAAARAAHIHDFIESLPEGYDTDVADMGARLSGGQRQRITIARALLKGAPLLLLDEATSALDSESEAEVQRALDELVRDRTVIVIAHRLSTVRDADRIAVLEAGRLVELGTHEELLRRGGTYARLYALQAPERGAELRAP